VPSRNEQIQASRIKRSKRIDRFARRVITVGGVAIIVSVIAILFLIVKVTLPLFEAPQAQQTASFSLPRSPEIPFGEPILTGVDEYLQTGYAADPRGRFVFFSLADGALRDSAIIEPESSTGPFIQSVESFGGNRHNLLWSDGSVTMAEVRFEPRFDARGERSIFHEVAIIATLPPDAETATASRLTMRKAKTGGLIGVALLETNHLLVRKVGQSTSANGEAASASYLIEDEIPDKITAFTLTEEGMTLYAGTDTGRILRWDLTEPKRSTLTDAVSASPDNVPISSLAMVFGDVSVAVGDKRGRLTTWMPARRDPLSESRRLFPIHELAEHQGGVAQIFASQRSKSLASIDSEGIVHLDHMTSERQLLTLRAGRPLTRIALAARDNGLLGLDDQGGITLWKIDAPHPEVSLKTLFGKVWYEGYDQPTRTWQSSSASDDFEPKLSIAPLIFGTLKGTLYAMLFAVPLAIFGAVYTSQFTTPYFRSIIKPAVEIMASVPSVVIGFLAALWLAPIMEQWLIPVLIAVPLVPAFFVLFMLAYQSLQASQRLSAFFRHREFLAFVPVLFLAVAAAYLFAPLVEQSLFAGDFKGWLFKSWSSRYDQRNSLVIAFALGITVIPIIFSLADDALSAIPTTLTATSLALGASRWQTV